MATIETLYLDTFTSGAPEDILVHVPDLSLVPSSSIPGVAGVATIDAGLFTPQSQSDFKDPGYFLESYNIEYDLDLDVVFGGGGSGILVPIRFNSAASDGYILIMTDTTRTWYRLIGGVANFISSAAHSGSVVGTNNVHVNVTGSFATLTINGVNNGQTNVSAFGTPGVHTGAGVQVIGTAPAPFLFNGWALDRFEVIGDSELIPAPPTPAGGTVADSKLKLGPNRFGTVPRAVPNRSALEIGLGR